MKKPSVENCLPTTEDKHRSPRKRRQQPEYLVLVAIIRVVILFIVSHLFSSFSQGTCSVSPNDLFKTREQDNLEGKTLRHGNKK